jgi:hypothetical protein
MVTLSTSYLLKIKSATDGIPILIQIQIRLTHNQISNVFVQVYIPELIEYILSIVL